MTQSRKVRISNSTLNQYGTRVLTEGVDLEQFRKNPILLWMHSRAWGGRKDDVLPIGHVENIQIEDDDITGELVFDEKDEFAMKLAQKWDDGILKMVSPNLDIIAVDESQELALPGQTRATISKSKLIELSVVDIGGNDANMVLFRDGKELKLSANGEGIDIPLLSASTHNKKEENMDFKFISLKLGLPETATEQEVMQKITLMQQNETDFAGLKTEIATLKAEKEALQLAGITGMVDTAILAGKFTAEKKTHFIELGKKIGQEELKLTLDSMQSAVKPLDVIGGGAGAGAIQLAGSDKWTKLSEVPAEKLAELRSGDKPTYMKLFKAEYGFDCKLD